MNLVVSERGTFLALRGERLQLRHPRQETQEVALRDLEGVTVTTTACTLSAEAAGMPVLVVPSVIEVPDAPGRSKATSLANISLDTLRAIVAGDVLSLT